MDKIDTNGMSDGEIYAEVSRRKNPEAHASIMGQFKSYNRDELVQKERCEGS